MAKIVNSGNHPGGSFNDCNSISPLFESLNKDDPVLICKEDLTPKDSTSQREVLDQDPQIAWLERQCVKKIGIGTHANCDPMQTGQIVDDIENPSRQVVYRYSQALRGANEGMMDLFRNLVVLDEDAKAHPVPIIWGSQERAVAAMLQDNFRKDTSLVVDRIKLPMLAINNTGMEMNQDLYLYHRAVDYLKWKTPDGTPGFTTSESGRDRDTIFGVARGIPINISYDLLAWTLYIEDMDQIVEQVITKFSPVAYIRVRGVQWETIVTLDSIANNIDIEPGDQKLRVCKFQFGMTAKTFIPQPLVRKKAILTTKIDMVRGTDLDQTTEILNRLESAVEDL